MRKLTWHIKTAGKFMRKGMLMSVEPLWEFRRTRNLTVIRDQCVELHDQVDRSKWSHPFVTCPCGRRASIHYMFQCYYCSIHFCKICAGVHFESERV